MGRKVLVHSLALEQQNCESHHSEENAAEHIFGPWLNAARSEHSLNYCAGNRVVAQPERNRVEQALGLGVSLIPLFEQYGRPASPPGSRARSREASPPFGFDP